MGQGSEFVVRLPLSAQALDQDHGPETGQQAATASSPSGHRLLVVDDNQDAADSLAMLLRLQGHEVRVAYSGMAALEMTKTYTPDVVFLDIGMPGMDGYEVARRIAAAARPGERRAGGADRLGAAGGPPPHGGSRVQPPSRQAPGAESAGGTVGRSETGERVMEDMKDEASYVCDSCGEASLQ